MKILLTKILLCLILLLTSCTNFSQELKTYSSLTQGYHFLYPNGWIKVDVKNHSPGVDVVFRDFLERTENVSVIISKIPNNETLETLGSPSEVGYRFLKQINNAPNSQVKLELLNAELRETITGNYYILEYQAHLPSGLERHDLASVTIRQGKLFTFNISTPENRWLTVNKLFETMVNSFTVDLYSPTNF